MSYYFVMQSRL